MDDFQAKLHKTFHFDPIVGVFINKIKRHTNSPIGYIQKCKDKYGYVVIYFEGKLYKAHRIAWYYVYGRWPENLIDHKNGNVADNSLSNLREADKVLNGINKGIPKNNTSGYKGVSYNKRERKYRAYITVDKKRIELGLFVDILDAAKASKDAEEKYFKGRKFINN